MSLVSRVRSKVRFLVDKKRTRQELWERRWSNRTEPMRWETEVPPQVLLDALDNGFIAPGSSVLDIGCGSGEIAALLASRGHRTVGYDFSTAAIERARELHSHELLHFEVRDAAEKWIDPAVYDVLFDRGCLHCLPDEAVSTYAANAAASLASGGKLLLLHKLERTSNELYPDGHVEAKLRAGFESEFTIDQLDQIDIMTGEADTTDPAIPALALWMTRR